MPIAKVAQLAKLTDDEWQLLEPLLSPRQDPHKAGRHRRDAREVFSAIIWVLDTENSWRSLPQSFPPWPTCYRWYVRWEQDGTLARARKKLRRLRKEQKELENEAQEA